MKKESQGDLKWQRGNNAEAILINIPLSQKRNRKRDY